MSIAEVEAQELALEGATGGLWHDALRRLVRNPAAIYYQAEGAVNRAYDQAVRRYYRSPLVTEIRTRIEQLREIS